MKLLLKNMLLASAVIMMPFATVFAQQAPTPSANDLLQAAQNIAAQNSNSSTTTSSSTTTTTTTSAPGPQCTATGFTFTNKQLLLNPEGSSIQRIFVLVNTSGYTVMINRTSPTSGGIGAGWGTKLDAGKAALLAMGQPNFLLGCMGYNPPQLGVTDCRSVIKVCALTPVNGIGTYWIAEDFDADKIGEALKSRNIAVK